VPVLRQPVERRGECRCAGAAGGRVRMRAACLLRCQKVNEVLSARTRPNQPVRVHLQATAWSASRARPQRLRRPGSTLRTLTRWLRRMKTSMSLLSVRVHAQNLKVVGRERRCVTSSRECAQVDGAAGTRFRPSIPAGTVSGGERVAGGRARKLLSAKQLAELVF